MPPVLQFWEDKLLVIAGKLATDPACCCGPPPECQALPFVVDRVENCITYNPTTAQDLLDYAKTMDMNFTIPDGMFTSLVGCNAGQLQCDERLNNKPIVLTNADNILTPLQWEYTPAPDPTCLATLYVIEATFRILCLSPGGGNCTYVLDLSFLNDTLQTVNYYEWVLQNNPVRDIGVLDVTLPTNDIIEGPSFHCPSNFFNPMNVTASII